MGKHARKCGTDLLGGGLKELMAVVGGLFSSSLGDNSFTA